MKIVNTTTSRRFSTTLLLTCTFANTYACSCTDVTTIESQTASANEIFIGRVLSGKIISDENKGSEAEVSVLEVLKGHPPSKTTLWSGRIGSSCATHFDIGIDYIFFVGEDSIVHHCTGTRRFNPIRDEDTLKMIKSNVRNAFEDNANQDKR